MELLRKTIQEAEKQIELQNFELALVLLTLCIEWMGAKMDKKPLKSPKQSKKRFSNAIDSLFGGRYAALNRDSFLYDRWRNPWLHAGSPSSWFMITENPDLKHLSESEKKQIIFIPSVFLKDVRVALKKLEGKVKA